MASADCVRCRDKFVRIVNRWKRSFPHVTGSQTVGPEAVRAGIPVAHRRDDEVLVYDHFDSIRGGLSDGVDFAEQFDVFKLDFFNENVSEVPQR